MILSVEHLTLGYEKIPVIEDLNFSLEEHDFLTVIGSNGSGKSTLVKGLLGLIHPLSGSITYTIDRRFIGYMPQETTVDDHFPASVYEVVLSGTLNRLHFKPFYSREEKKLALDCLKRLQIDDIKDRSFADLSGGQRQKVLLARALSATSSLLVLDEPSNNLDYESRKEFYDLIKDLNTKEGITIILITHDLAVSGIMGNKVLSFDDHDIFFGFTQEFRIRGQQV